MPNPAPGFATHPNHTITIDETRVPLSVTLGGEVVAETEQALVLRESGYPPRCYVPIKDVRDDLLRPSTRTSHCPFKGDAAYWSVSLGARTAEDAVWGYTSPYDEVAPIAGHVAFYADKFDSVSGGPSS